MFILCKNFSTFKLFMFDDMQLASLSVKERKRMQALKHLIVCLVLWVGLEICPRTGPAYISEGVYLQNVPSG
jgi:hypothetical protein